MLKQFIVLVPILALGLLPNASTAGANVAYSSGSSQSIVSSSGGGAINNNGKIISSPGTVVAKGPNKTEERKVSGFSGISVDGPINLSYTVAPAISVKVTSAANILPLVTTVIEGKLLVVRIKGSVVMTEPVRVVANGPSLESLIVSGTGDIQASGLSGKQLRIDISGSGNIVAFGQVEKLEAKVSGSGDVDVSKLKASEVTASVTGSGDMTAYASQSVKLDVSGSGDITIDGNPKRRMVNRSGSGDVEFR